MLSKIGIQFSKTSSTTFEVGSVSYPILTTGQEQKLRNWLQTNHGANDADEVMDLVIDWKDDSYCDRAQTLSRIFKQGLPTPISAPVRNGSLNGRSPRGAETAIAKDLQKISESFVKQMISGTRITIHRGVGHALAELVKELLENASRNQQGVNANALANYTPSRGVAETFGRVRLRQQIDIDQIALAADCLFPYRTSSGSVDKCHCELRVRGDAVSSVATQDIHAEQTTRPLIELFQNPSRNTFIEHDVVAGVIVDMADEGVSVSTQAATTLIDAWYSEYLRNHPNNAIPIRNEVAAVR